MGRVPTRFSPVQPRIPYTDPVASVIVPDTPGPYADWNLINWSSGERKLFGVLHVNHISDLRPVGDGKIKSISPPESASAIGSSPSVTGALVTQTVIYNLKVSCYYIFLSPMK